MADFRWYHHLHRFSHILFLRVMSEKLIGSGDFRRKSKMLDCSFGEDRFLRDLKKTATLTSGERATAGALAVFVPGIFTGSFPQLRFEPLLNILDRFVCCELRKKVDEK
jgi:hypothetical protein